MNKVLLIFSIGFLFSCSNSPQERAEIMIRDSVIKSLGNPALYKPVSFSPLRIDTIEDYCNQIARSTSQIIVLREFEDNLFNKSRGDSNIMESYGQLYDTELSLIQQKYSEDSIIFYSNPDSFLTYFIEHKFKIVDTKGKEVEKTKTFRFNRRVTKFY